MKLSARNKLKGTVTAISEGMIVDQVTLDIGNGIVTALISRDSVKELGLKKGSTAYAVIKSTEVMVAKDDMTISARNKLTGIVTSVSEGKVMAKVTINLGDTTVTALISKDSVEDLGLQEGSKASAVIKATEVMVAVD